MRASWASEGASGPRCSAASDVGPCLSLHHLISYWPGQSWAAVAGEGSLQGDEHRSRLHVLSGLIVTNNARENIHLVRQTGGPRAETVYFCIRYVLTLSRPEVFVATRAGRAGKPGGGASPRRARGEEEPRGRPQRRLGMLRGAGNTERATLLPSSPKVSPFKRDRRDQRNKHTHKSTHTPTLGAGQTAKRKQAKLKNRDHATACLVGRMG